MCIYKFSSNNLKYDLLECLGYFKGHDNRYLSFSSDYLSDFGEELEDMIHWIPKIKSINEEYTKEDYEEFVSYDWEEGNSTIELNGDTDIQIYLDDSDNYINTTLHEFIEVAKLANIASEVDGIIYTSIMSTIRTELYSELDNYDELCGLSTTFNYKGVTIDISLSDNSNLFLLQTYFNDNFSEYYPLFIKPELFVEISYPKDSISFNDIKEIFNVFSYTLYTSTENKLVISPRLPIEVTQYDEDDDEDYDDNNDLSTAININMNLFGKGMLELLQIFNEAESFNLNTAIVEYIKVIEYVSVTVVRSNIIQEIQNELNKLNNINTNADCVLKLIELFETMNKNMKTDSELIKQTIDKCCNIRNISIYSPKFINGLFQLNDKISANPEIETKLVKQAYCDLCTSITNTRNKLSHAKANYTTKQYECPDSEKVQFVKLLKFICIEVIEWFSSTDEKIRITRELDW